MPLVFPGSLLKLHAAGLCLVYMTRIQASNAQPLVPDRDFETSPLSDRRERKFHDDPPAVFPTLI